MGAVSETEKRRGNSMWLGEKTSTSRATGRNTGRLGGVQEDGRGSQTLICAL